LKEILKYYYKNSKIGNKLLYLPKIIRDLFYFIKTKNLTDEEFIKLRYKINLNKEINLTEPILFTEKIQWLKLNDRNELYTQCADKYLVRRYVEDKIGSNYLIPLLFETKDYQDIKSSNLPEYPVIIKTNHDSGGVFIIDDKNSINFLKIRREIKKRLLKSHYSISREWEYKNIKPRIIVEKLLKDSSGNNQLNDYKIYCFHGEPTFIQTIFDRGNETKEDWYDTNWNLQDAYYFSAKKKYVKKPKQLDELLKVAKKLSKDFPYVRVDLYIVDNKIYFGELTFRPYGGFMKFVPESFDNDLGKYLDLNKI
jgi:hypothetical protein